jgi:hypothetical protein
MTIDFYDGSKFTILLVDEDDEHVVFGGWTASVQEGKLLLRKMDEQMFQVLSEWIGKISKIEDEEVREILEGADYLLRLTVGSLPTDISDSEFLRTGLTWPE